MNHFDMKILQRGLLAGLLLATPAVLAQSATAANTPASLQQQVQQLQTDMAKLRRLLDNRGLLELIQRMDDLADEVSSLRGMLEQQNHDLAGVKKRQRELYLDTDRRLRELEITSSRTPAAAAPSQQNANTQPASSPTGMPKQKATTVTPPPVSMTPPVEVKPVTGQPVASPAVQKPRPSATMSEERAAYQKAFDMLKEGRYKAANAAFKSFLSKYPDSSYAGNSQYWLGESNYVTRQFEQAVKEFQTVLKRYPSSNKVPDAMLKLGYTWYELHQFEKARAILTQLRKQNPKSTAARLAAKRLDRMRREGH